MTPDASSPRATPHHTQPTRSFARRAVVLAAAAWLIGGWATTVGPKVSDPEIEAARRELQVKSFHRFIEQQRRVWTIGQRLVNALPPAQRPKSAPDYGFMAQEIDGALRAAFGYPNTLKRGVAVTLEMADGPAAKAGLRAGDVLRSVDGQDASSIRRLVALLSDRKAGQTLAVRLLRGEAELDIPLTVGEQPGDIEFLVAHDQSVNAWTDGHVVIITSGMLRFVESDDEVAVVLGHELAHITEGHRNREMATGLLATIVGGVAGLATDLLPGPSLRGGMMQAGLSREFEREADYKGLLHTFRAGYDVRAGIDVWERFGTEIPESLLQHLNSTHPSSPERMVRLRKIAASLKDRGLDATIAEYEPARNTSTTPAALQGTPPALDVGAP